ncbi:CRISPR-associated helicase Cas3' [Pseudoalteromonas rubra]|uniref:CRISPR-associated helicase/endonuclease Cas3 n=1 Tax=Pseudoalteromonas rubra TaxID=43658 RepID=A0A5S3X1J0_9GAMM|nr:CRISPR-associated helicase Cas3' [Pseudoalteromonas rubra]TMP37380.1 CRISPR-associated helicase/endonuclease Cas3 [Pseudoalteromonas rubra]
MPFIAHPAATGSEHQSVLTHLREVKVLAEALAEKFGYAQAGALIGLLHDFGKYSAAFQGYMDDIITLKQAHANPDLDEDIESLARTVKGQKGTINHSTAGAQWLVDHLMQIAPVIFKEDSSLSQYCMVVVQGLALCIVSHHSGLINCLAEPSGGLRNRLDQGEEATHLNECTQNANPEVLNEARKLAGYDFLKSAAQALKTSLSPYRSNKTEHDFYLGIFVKLWFSCLIDADRTNSADFETPGNEPTRNTQADWHMACALLESKIAGFDTEGINQIRAAISANCQQKALGQQGIYSLTVPTGGGKNLASLRFALHHAKQHQLDRIIYVIPYTSIIEQNAQAVRDVFGDELGEQWVLEHHSNLEPEVQTWRTKLACENWDKPIVFTTMVQFLESLFGGGTRGVRRLHQLSKAVLIFDEIQTLPINCVHLFNNAVNFLTRHCHTTAVMCTATQPLLNKLPERVRPRGELALTGDNELTPDISKLYQALERVTVRNLVRPRGWDESELTALIAQQLESNTSCLVIVNTKHWAKALYHALNEHLAWPDGIFHLSTDMCAAHRKAKLDEIRSRLDDGLPTLCLSTALIEAGVDVDFNTVVRFLAGLDSIAQAAGRCNRHGRQQGMGEVLVVNPHKENLNMLTDIKQGVAATKYILDADDFDEAKLLSPEYTTRYFDKYFYERCDEMGYPTGTHGLTQGQSQLVDLLSSNEKNIEKSPIAIRQAFMVAGKAFKAINAPTQGVIVPYDNTAKTLISALLALDKRFDAAQYRKLLQQAQKYSVNVFTHKLKQLLDSEAAYPIAEDEPVYYLRDEHYSSEFGLSLEICGEQEGLVL